MLKYEDYTDFMKIHHDALSRIAQENIKDDSNNYLEGNIYTFDGKNSGDFMHIKMKNIFNIAQLCDKAVLEIGFNAGNSALLFLTANPKIKFYAVDIVLHSYVKKCVDYLNSVFDNRIILLEGSSLDVLPKLERNLGDEISLYHIDGWHVLEGIQADLKNCFELSKDGAFIITDDTNTECIKNEYDMYVIKNKIKNRPDLVLEKPLYWPHEIGQFVKQNISDNDVIDVISL
jgi:predicted O-methyltransferase YrrM